MKTIEIIGYKRANLGKTEAKQLRAEGMVPCVLYGGENQIHFYTPMILFRDLVYTDEVCFVNLTIEGEATPFKAIIQDSQYHPVSEVMLHADFLQLFDDKAIKMNIPVHPVGTAPGISQGGKLIKKVKYLQIKALPENMPEYVELDVSDLGLGKSKKVKDIEPGNYEIQNSPLVTLVSIEVPRALRGKGAAEEEEEGEE